MAARYARQWSGSNTGRRYAWSNGWIYLFAGVITVRNVDSGALVNEGNTLLFRLAQTDRLRTYLNVPQTDAESVRTGQRASVEVPDLRGRKFAGTVSRTANALDPASRTLERVHIEDATAAEKIFTDLMGDKVEPRKAFIERHAKEVRFLDV